MAQHFLLSAEARTLSLKEIYKGGEEKAYADVPLHPLGCNAAKLFAHKCGCCDTYEITDPPQVQVRGLWFAVLGYVRHDLRLAQDGLY